jgi:hypothetical protein
VSMRSAALLLLRDLHRRQNIRRGAHLNTATRKKVLPVSRLMHCGAAPLLFSCCSAARTAARCTCCATVARSWPGVGILNVRQLPLP